MQPQLACLSNKMERPTTLIKCEDGFKSVFKWENFSYVTCFTMTVEMDGGVER